MWRSLNLAVTSLHKIFHRLRKNRDKQMHFIVRVMVSDLLICHYEVAVP